MKRCVYTVLTGSYEPLNEQAVGRESDLPFICFTDDPATACEGWEIRPLTPVFSADHIRNQRAYKLQAHLVLPEFDQSLYIDNSVQLRMAPERIFEAVDLSAGVCLPLHSYRACLLDEFQIIAQDLLDDPRRVAEQLEHYQDTFPEVLAGPVLWTALLLRDHHAPKVKAAMEIWLAHVYRYTRRDQLSSTVAFHLAGLKPTALVIDNYESAFHTWPHLAGRKTERRIWQDTSPQTLAVQREIAGLRQTLDSLQHEHRILGQAHDGLQHAHHELRQALDMSEHERHVARQEHDVLQQLHDAVLLERDASLQDRDQLRRQLDLLQCARDSMLSSTSWRVTAPMRALKEMATPASLKKTRKKGS